MFDEQLELVCRKLAPFIGEKRARALLLNYRTSETLNYKLENESLIHFFASKYLSKDYETILLPPPSEEDAKGEFYLGQILYGGNVLYPLYLIRENFQKHIGILGLTGSGKTILCQNLLLGLLEKHIPFLVVDWKRSYRDLRSLESPKSVQAIQIYTVGRKTSSPLNWNPLRAPPGIHPKTWIMVIAEGLERSHLSGPGVADIFMEIFDEAFEKLGFYENTNGKHANFFDAAEELNRKRYVGRRMLWRDSCSRILKTFTFSPAKGAFNSRYPIKLEQLLEKPVIIELDQELPKTLRVFFSEIILRWIHLYRLGQGETDSLRHVLVLEEAHNLFPVSLHEKFTTNSLENLFREIRGFGEGLVYITQHPSTLPVYTLGNSSTLMVLGLQHSLDIKTARQALFLDDGDEVYLDRLGVGEGIVKIKGRVPPCHVKFPHVLVRKGAITDDMLAPGGEENPEKDLD